MKPARARTALIVVVAVTSCWGGCKSSSDGSRGRADDSSKSASDDSGAAEQGGPGSDDAAQTTDGGEADELGDSGLDSAPAADAEATDSAMFSFEIRNSTDSVVYLNGGPVQLACRDSVGESCQLFPIDCMMNCSDFESGQACCSTCEPPRPSAIRLKPGKSHILPWAGLSYVRQDRHCSDCSCQEAVALQRGTFTASVRAYPDFVCDDGGDDCRQVVDGQLLGARVAGISSVHEVQFDVPLGRRRFTLDIDAP